MYRGQQPSRRRCEPEATTQGRGPLEATGIEQMRTNRIRYIHINRENAFAERLVQEKGETVRATVTIFVNCRPLRRLSGAVDQVCMAEGWGCTTPWMFQNPTLQSINWSMLLRISETNFRAFALNVICLYRGRRPRRRELNQAIAPGVPHVHPIHIFKYINIYSDSQSCFKTFSQRQVHVRVSMGEGKRPEGGRAAENGERGKAGLCSTEEEKERGIEIGLLKKTGWPPQCSRWQDSPRPRAFSDAYIQSSALDLT